MVCVLPEAKGCKFEKHDLKAWSKFLAEIENDGATICEDLEKVAETLNARAKTKDKILIISCFLYTHPGVCKYIEKQGEKS